MKKILTLLAMAFVTMGAWAQDTWTVAGSNAIFGSEWNINDDANNMIKNTDGDWQLVKTDCVLEANSEYKFKVVKNHSWDEAYPSSDYVIMVSMTATFTVTIKFNETSHAIEVSTDKTGEATIGEKTWTVAGDEALMGSSWKPENEENDMVKQADGTYKLVKANVTLAAGSYKFKVCANHGWSEAYPGSDYILRIDEDGIYDVTFTFNSVTREVGASVEKKETVVIETTWTVAGDEALMGNNWKPEDTTHDMQKQDDGTYTLVLTNVTLEQNWYGFKVCANHGWSESYGKDGGSDNAVLIIEEAGTYDVTFFFNPNTDPKTVKAEATLSSTTAITQIVNGQSSNANIFDLQGRRVAQPRHGLYIVNGKKVIK